MFTLINRVQLWAFEKQLKSIEFRRKKSIPTIFVGVGAKMINGKRKKTPTENNEIAPGTSLESGY